MDIVMISGKQGSGKTTTQQLLGKVWYDRFGGQITYVNFADILYEMHDEVLKVLNRYWPRRDIAKDGPLLQVLGTDWGRKTIDEDIWVKCLKKKIQSEGNSLVVIGDCRFENEFDAFPEALRIRLECPEAVRKARCSMWRENSTHPSEVGLDRYAAEGRFDLTLKTNEMPIEGCVKLIESTICVRSWVPARKDPAVLNATRLLKQFADSLTGALRTVETDTGCQANFKWVYNSQGQKELTVADVAKIAKPTDETVVKAQAEVPDIMKMAEGLVGNPVEVKPNDQPAGS